MISERQEELAALHALELLEGTERSVFESEVAANPELAAFVDSLVENASALAVAAPQVSPPAALRARVIAAVEEASRPKLIAFPASRFAPWAVAAALAVAATWFATRNYSLQTENQSLRTERELAEMAYKMVQNQLSERSLLAENIINHLGNKLRKSEDLSRLKVAALASLAGNSTEAKAIAVWDPDQQAGLLTIEKLPAIADSQDYQIWVVDPAYPNPVNGGVFHTTPDGNVALAFKPDQPVAQAAAFAISLEKKGGVPKAEGPIVLLGKQ